MDKAEQSYFLHGDWKADLRGRVPGKKGHGPGVVLKVMDSPAP